MNHPRSTGGGVSNDPNHSLRIGIRKKKKGLTVTPTVLGQCRGALRTGRNREIYVSGK